MGKKVKKPFYRNNLYNKDLLNKLETYNLSYMKLASILNISLKQIQNKFNCGYDFSAKQKNIIQRYFNKFDDIFKENTRIDIFMESIEKDVLRLMKKGIMEGDKRR